MVFTELPSANLNGTSPNVTSWPDDYNLTTPSSLVHTAVDALFGFDDSETHPIFSNFPQPSNTVLNASGVYGHESVYLLGASSTGTYTMCSIRVAQSSDCYTEYNASMSGGSLTSHCGDHPLAYSKSDPKAPSGFWDKDWKDVGQRTLHTSPHPYGCIRNGMTGFKSQYGWYCLSLYVGMYVRLYSEVEPR